MSNIYRVVNFSIIKAPEGNRVAYTLYEIDEQGNIVKDNLKKAFAVLDVDLEGHINAIEDYIKTREGIL